MAPIRGFATLKQQKEESLRGLESCFCLDCGADLAVEAHRNYCEGC